ncbi:2-oxoacid:acceptor oxidoreductase subunit alpha [Candidatus Poribacteria bacterium]|nr:2-oxoacid:acceptor oxidoreductase subunit alpha [Candidatus Poribacteria bacterium]
MSKAVMTGVHFMQGNIACAEGALASGCRFFAGYPITPATEIAEHLALRMPEVDGMYIQMEDEIGSIAAVIGASWTGTKAMTATSGPGISLMQENIGYAVGTETPCVIVDIQRGGPTTGIPAVPFQGDILQARRGSHGEYEIIALSPASPQEMFDLTIQAFNLAEKFRTPVYLMADAFVGHMREQVVIPEPDDIQLIERKIPNSEIRNPKSEIRIAGFLDEDVAPMPIFGHGFKAHVTGSCHDRYGHRNVEDAEALDFFVKQLSNKIRKHADEIIMTESSDLDDADIAIISYGSVARAGKAAAIQARALGFKVGTFRPITLWPFPETQVAELAKQVETILVLENNLGQLFHYVKAAAKGNADVRFVPPTVLGTLHHPEQILEEIKRRET